MNAAIAWLSDVLMTWFDAAGWRDGVEVFFVLMSVVGQHHISQRRVQGFYFWIIGNIAAIFLFFSIERWATCLLYGYFLYKSFQGARVWRALDLASTTQGAPLKPM